MPPIGDVDQKQINFEGAPKKNIPIELTLEKARALRDSYGSAQPVFSRPVDDGEPHKICSVLVDAASAGGAPGEKPLVRHVLVKDLHGIAKRGGTQLPRSGIFSGKAGIGMYAIFDGTSCGDAPGPMAAEYCARNFHTKLLQRFSTLPEIANEVTLVNMLRMVFKDLDEEIVGQHPEIQDSCGVVLALLIGDNLFTALVGKCRAALCMSQDDARLSRWTPSSGSTSTGVEPIHLTAESALNGTLGFSANKVNGSLSATPWVRHFSLAGFDRYPVLILLSTAASILDGKDVVEVAKEFILQPKASCTDIAGRAYAAHKDAGATKEQCTMVEMCFLPIARGLFQPAGQQPPAKKAKLGDKQESFRLRHILVTFDDGSAANKKKRSRQEAETTLREAVRELRRKLQEVKKPPTDAAQLVTLSTPIFGEVCKNLSECETAKKGGNMRGELGWMTPGERGLYGPGFKEAVDVLLPGQLSDIAASKFGLHIVQRMA